MNYLTHLKRAKICESTRWIVKFNSQDRVREVKEIWRPDEYILNSRARKLYTKEEVIEILENNNLK